MNLAAIATGIGPDADKLDEAFALWAYEQGIELYPAQVEALLEIFTDSHLILSTPTGSGKSLVAVGAHFHALAHGKRSYYTAPLKALVSEKFFALIDVFGAENVGMLTGDSAVNPDAPIICCTAEILANVALREGADTDAGVVIMDEFHFYADPQRGWAWQVPLIELPRAQFILLSATLGDTSRFVEDLEERTGRPVAEVTSTTRPVPLTYTYNLEPLPETILELLHTHRAPVYIVHFTQKDAVEQAQALLGTAIATKAEKEAIATELGEFRFTAGFGRTLSKLLRHGVGIHHAGMLPRYRRVVERLTQQGLLKVICGTDTLGVGINVPIRTVLFTSLVKYDGERMRHLTAREFHQIAGRAGRAGYDTVGDVLVQAPPHVIDNRKLLEKAGDDPRKQRKIVRKKAPEGMVNWTDKTFERLRDSPPEALVSHFKVDHSMILNVLSRPGDPIAAMRNLLTLNHDTAEQKVRHVRRALLIYHSLRVAQVVERLPEPDAQGRRIRLTIDIAPNFALNQPLSPFALAAMDLLEINSPTHTLDVISVIEATLDNPRAVLYAQEKTAKRIAVAELKADGYEYDERMAILDTISWPQPLRDVLEPAFEMYRRTNPWLTEHELAPKSVVRDMLENAMTFPEFISRYDLDRSEGIVLRYLTDAYRALRQTVPGEHRTEEIEGVIQWLGQTLRSTDSSLLDEWELLSSGHDDELDSVVDQLRAQTESLDPGAASHAVAFTANTAALRLLIRNAMFRRIELAAYEDYGALGALDAAAGWPGSRWADALDPLFDEHGADAIGIGPSARSSQFFTVRQGIDPAETHLGGVSSPDAADPRRTWWVEQVIEDPAGHNDWAISAIVPLDECDAAEKLVLHVQSVGERIS